MTYFFPKFYYCLAINGPAVGAGLCLALSTDIRVVAEDAKLALNFVHLVIPPYSHEHELFIRFFLCCIFSLSPMPLSVPIAQSPSHHTHTHTHTLSLSLSFSLSILSLQCMNFFSLGFCFCVSWSSHVRLCLNSFSGHTPRLRGNPLPSATCRNANSKLLVIGELSSSTCY